MEAVVIVVTIAVFLAFILPIYFKYKSSKGETLPKVEPLPQAKIFRVRAPQTIKLHSMSDQEISEIVATKADKVLENFPSELRPIGVNTIRVDQIAADFWGEWTRACCNRRNEIEEYTDPVRGDWEVVTPVEGMPLPNEHLESSFKVQSLSNPEMHTSKELKK